MAVLFLLIASPAFAQTANLSWTDNSNNEDGFVIERSLNKGAFTVLAAGVGVNVITFSDSTLVADPQVDNEYCYRVAAFNTAGQSGYTNTACITVKRTLPADPSNLIVNLQQAKLDMDKAQQSYAQARQNYAQALKAVLEYK
jgi:hypothetical protein